jgi:tRNA threonylcarbamoyladenosine biosynthesis protein TsaB
MSSLNERIAANSPLLLIDAASLRVQVGWLERDRPPRWSAIEEEAGVAVFLGIETLGVRPRDAGAYVFCDGPGSILGIRTVAMALRTWCALAPRPVFAYHSLEVIAHALDRPDLHVIADARRDSWHCVTTSSPLRRIPTAELTGELVTPEEFRNWTPLPANVARVPYSLETMLPHVADRDLFRATDAPDAFLHEEPSYATWTPHVHRAP